MNITDLSREELLLINTDFGEDLEKTAEAIVYEGSEKLAEAQDVAESCLAYGSEIAMQKIAALEAKYEAKEDEDEDEDEDEENGEGEKTASAMGNFILEGFWDTLMEKGAEYYGPENAGIYVEEMCKEAGIARQMKNFVKKHNVFSGAAMGARKANKSKKLMTEYAKKKGIKLDSGAYENLMRGVSKKSLAKGKKDALRNRYIGAGVAGAAAVGGAYAAGRRQ